MKPLKLESRNAKLNSEHEDQEHSSNYEDMLDDVNMMQRDEEDEEDYNENEETRFIRIDRTKSNYYTSSERT